MESKKVNLSSSNCSECDSSEVILKKARKSFCKECWRYHCEFRFRKRLFEFGRPAKGTVGEVFKPAEHTIIYYDGSPTSVALINLALNAMISGLNQKNETGGSQNLPFPLRFSIVVILESELNGSPGVVGKQKKHLQSLLKWIQHANNKIGGVSHFPLLPSSLEMSLKEFHTEESVMMFKDSPIVVSVKSEEQDKEGLASEGPVGTQLQSFNITSLPIPVNESLDCHLMELRKSLKSKTDDKDFVGVLKKNLLCAIAEQLNISKIFLPEDQTSLAVKMFSMMSLGRGSQVADEMAFTSPVPNSGICLGRPLIDFSDDDLRVYCDTLPEDCTEGIVSKGAKRKMKIDSVDRQCDDFIVNLQTGYPATVSTLTRIGAKLQSNISSGNGDEMEISPVLCNFCKKQVENTSNCNGFCYGCQHFLSDAHPEKKDFFKNLFQLKI